MKKAPEDLVGRVFRVSRCVFLEGFIGVCVAVNSPRHVNPIALSFAGHGAPRNTVSYKLYELVLLTPEEEAVWRLTSA